MGSGCRGQDRVLVGCVGHARRGGRDPRIAVAKKLEGE